MKSRVHTIWFFTTTTALILSVLLLVTLLIVETSGGGLGKKRQTTAEEDDDFAEFDDDDFDESETQFGKRPKPKEAPPAADLKGSAPPKSKDQSEDADDFGDDFEESVEDKVKVDEKTADDEAPKTNQKEPGKGGFDEDDEALVEDDDFVGIDDDEFDDDIPSETGGGGAKRRGESGTPKLTITDVPMPMRGWQAYWAELLMLTGIGVYLLNYIIGRYKNQNIAQTFFESNWTILEENFCYLGEGPSANVDDEGTRTFSKQSDSQFQIWCSGRTSCEGMLLELKLLKRQDLIGILSNIFRPMRDVFRFTVEMNRDEMDNMVFAVANKKNAIKMKEYNDLINYCPEKKPGEKYGLASQFVVMTEMGEVATAILDQKTSSVINKYASLIESIHFSDQFTGTKTTEPETTKDGVMKAPEPKKLLIFTFILPVNNSGSNLEHALEEIQPLFQFVFHTVDRFKRVRLSKEGKMKADKNRAKVEEAFLKQTHAARAAALQERKEEKRRQEKERILQEDDPEKQRRWEEKEQKREKKKKAPKMKQLKVKAM